MEDKIEISLEKLHSLIEEIEIKRQSRSLSDEYLLDHNCSTRDDIGIGEYSYGIIMIPEDWVLPYFKYLEQYIKDNADYEKDLTETEIKLRLAEKMIDKMTDLLGSLNLSKDGEGYEIMTKDDWFEYFRKKVEE